MNWKLFLGACILASGLLFKAGAPVPAVVMGLVLAALLTWRRHRAIVPTVKKKQL